MLDGAQLKFTSESSLLIEFENKLDDNIHHQVLKLSTALDRSTLAADIEVLPCIRSLVIYFDPFVIDHDHLLEVILSLSFNQLEMSEKQWQVPICFEGECGEDIAQVAQILKLPERDIIKLIVKNPLKLYMVGFVPGLAYLGGLNNSLNIPRRKSPRPPMPSNALMIAGGLACLTSASMPTGWYVIGRTPIPMFDVLRQPMLPFNIGDQLQFYEVDLVTFKAFQIDNLKDTSAFKGLKQINERKPSDG